MNSTFTAEQYSILCDLFERFGHGIYETTETDDDIRMTSPQARAFAIRAIEVMGNTDGDSYV